MKTILTHRLADKKNCQLNYLALDLIDIKENFSDMMQIYTFLDDVIVNILNFNPIHKPTLIPYYYGKVKHDCGVSCYSFFDGGYVTFHIFEKRRLAYFDIISDESFDIDKVLKFVLQVCETNKYNVYTNKTKNMICDKNVFGPHYIAYGMLYNDMNINQLLDLQERIINETNMTPIINPVIVKDSKGVKLFIAIAESHISLTLNNKEFILDVFSCKMFDANKLRCILNSIIQISNEIMLTRLNKEFSYL